MSTDQHVSKWWYLLPIIFGIIGGIVAWFRFRKTNPNKAQRFVIAGLLFTMAGWVGGDYLLNPWFDELEQVNHWCAEEFDKAVAGKIDINGNTMIENECFTHFDDWKDSSVSLNDGTAQELLDEKGMRLDEMVQHNIKREMGLN